MTESSKPKLLFIYANQFGYHTDSYKYCEYLQHSFDVFYICFDQGFEHLQLPMVKVVYIPFNIGKVKRLINFFYQVIQFAHNTEIDIIFTIQFKFCFLISLFARSRIKILDYRSGDLSANAIIRKLKNSFLWFDSLFFRHVSVISEGLRDLLHLNKAGTLILPLGGDIISTHSHSFERMDLLYVGSLNFRNIHQTIEGLAIFLAKHNELSSLVSYTIIGFGNKHDDEKIKQTIERLHLNDFVRFPGRKKYTELPPYFDTSNIGISYIPKIPCYEYQPVTKTFEYANSGLFTIATSTYENSKIISEKNGILCDDSPESFANAIEVIYERRDKINDQEIRASLKDFHWEKIVNTILKPYLINLLTA